MRFAGRSVGSCVGGEFSPLISSEIGCGHMTTGRPGYVASSALGGAGTCAHTAPATKRRVTTAITIRFIVLPPFVMLSPRRTPFWISGVWFRLLETLLRYSECPVPKL